MPKSKSINKQDSVMSKLLSDSTIDIRQFNVGDVVEGMVVSTDAKSILVDVGAKSEGIITSDEFSISQEINENIKPGDTVLAVVIQSDSSQGHLVLSLKRAEKERRWRDIELAYKNGTLVEATILEYNKGGLLVDCFGLRGFVPLSHLDRVHFADNSQKAAGGAESDLKEAMKFLSGRKIKTKVIEFDKEKNRLVLSEKDAVTEYSDLAKEEKLKTVKTGDVLEGIVTGIMPFGVFVDLGGIEGLVHISEIAWEKVSHPSNYYSVGSTIQVKVLGVDEDSKKLALSVKQLSENPWINVNEKYPVGCVVTGKVSKVVPFGAFVNLEKGLDALIHVTETTGPLNEGDDVTAVVTNVDSENQKLALSIKQLQG